MLLALVRLDPARIRVFSRFFLSLLCWGEPDIVAQIRAIQQSHATSPSLTGKIEKKSARQIRVLTDALNDAELVARLYISAPLHSFTYSDGGDTMVSSNEVKKQRHEGANPSCLPDVLA